MHKAGPVIYLTKEVLSLSEFLQLLSHGSIIHFSVNLSHLWLPSLILFILILPFVLLCASLFFVMMASFCYQLSRGWEIFQCSALRESIICLQSLDVKNIRFLKSLVYFKNHTKWFSQANKIWANTECLLR